METAPSTSVEVNELEIAPSVCVEVNELETASSTSVEVNERNKITSTSNASFVCISRVPRYFKEKSEAQYVPEVVGLGPFHHNFQTDFLNFRIYKIEAVRRLLRRRRTSQSSPADNIDSSEWDALLKLVEGLAGKIKSFYQGDIQFNPKKFILDGCFFLEILWILNGDCPEGESGHPFFDRRRLEGSLGSMILQDFIKLENQIPLELLGRLARHFSLEERYLMFYLYVALENLSPFKSYLKVKDIGEQISKILEDTPYPRHALEFLRQIMAYRIRNSSGNGNPKEGKEEEGDLKKIPRLVDFETAGITVVEGNGLSFEEKFFGFQGVLKLPVMDINDNSETVFRNVMMFEEFFHSNLKNNLVSTYVGLMDEFIDKEEDVAILCHSKVIRWHGLQSNRDVSNLFNGLGFRITVSNISQTDFVRRKISYHYQNSWKRTIRDFLSDHFSRPTLVFGTIAAVIIVVCTLVQTIYSAK